MEPSFSLMVERKAFMFNREYWASSAEKLRSTKYLAIMAAMIAMKIVVASYYLPLGDNLRVYVSFLLVALEACILGPVAGMVSGALSDILGFMIFPNGPFFLGYTLTAMSSSLIYSLFLYRTQITAARLASAKVLVNYLVNVLMGSLWSAILYSRGYWYYLVKSLIKNTLLLPFEIAALIAVFNLLLPYLIKTNLAVRQDSLPIRIFRRN